MKILIKWMLSLLFTLIVLPNAQAYDDEKKIPSAIEGSLISGWANSAVIFEALDKGYDLEAIGFPLTSKATGPSETRLINKSETHQIAIVFDNKAFSAQSGFSHQRLDQINEQTFFIQGSYRVLQQENFALLVTAKIESLSDHSIYQFYSNDFVSSEVSSRDINGAKSYARFGILGQYSINNNWYVSGGLTSTAHEDSTNNLPIYTIQKEQVAIFGTTYTF
ncbi:hypothetical protein A3Q34_13080 [Colwellia sp. PAMC 20917]|uniref:hypothetical protein n=1 Tax=Colwellia sp. PAMC 20917 TaxID=1816218 RepID=UPI0008787A26|nr:hypothetical protein [Colwellia sp. PAMC 20917]AOW77699.1 hypothetical protein A3Q34_13080 [Colwellia sp. PAMC 20917]